MVAVANSLDEINIDWKWLDEILVPTLGEVVSTVGAMCECITRWVLIVAVYYYTSSECETSNLWMNAFARDDSDGLVTLLINVFADDINS